MKLTPQYITTSPTSTCKPAPPPYTPSHILDLEPPLRNNDQNEVCKVKISHHNLASMIKIKFGKSKFQCHLQSKARVQPAPTTLAVNGHGFTVRFFWWNSHLNTLRPAQPTLASQPPPLTHQATWEVQIHTLAFLIKFNFENSKSQFHLQSNTRVQPAPATLAINGHGFTLNIFQWNSHLNTLQFTTSPTALASQPPPLTHKATS
jgi:hypothetical protein